MKIAIDGPAASGKGTLAKRIAQQYGLAYLDTGLLYRAVARGVLAAGGDLTDAVFAAHIAKDLSPQSLDDPRLRDAETGKAA
ncbi:MAG: (d)CMP kinase, partial [Pseudomonadota bacterium]